MYEGKVEIFLAKPTAREGKLAEESPGRGNEHWEFARTKGKE